MYIRPSSYSSRRASIYLFTRSRPILSCQYLPFLFLFSSPSPLFGRLVVDSHLPVLRPATPVHSSPRPAGKSPTAAVAVAPQLVTQTATLSHSPDGRKQQYSNIVMPIAKPGISQSLPAISTCAPATILAPISTSLPNTPSESYDSGVASVSSPSHFPPSIGSSISVSRPTGRTTLPRLRARGLVDIRNIYFANAVLQLPCFKEQGDLKKQRGAGVPETDGGATHRWWMPRWDSSRNSELRSRLRPNRDRSRSHRRNIEG